MEPPVTRPTKIGSPGWIRPLAQPIYSEAAGCLRLTSESCPHLENPAMAQIMMILALGTILTNVTQDGPLTWPWQPDLCQAVGCQGPVKQEKCGAETYNSHTHLCCGNRSMEKVLEKPTPRHECCGSRVYNQETQLCCEDLSIEPRPVDCRKDGGNPTRTTSGTHR